MPIPAAALSSLVGVGDSLSGFAMEQAINARNQKQYQKQYQQQKADNIAFWQMQNEYNTPEKQMQRFRDAKLNPNLIYGQGNNGNAGNIQAPSASRPNAPYTPDKGLAAAAQNALQYKMDSETRQLSNDNLRADNTIKLEQAQLVNAQTKATLIGAGLKQYDLDFKSETRPNSLEYQSEKLRGLKTSTDISLQRNAREAASLASSVADAAQRMAESRQRVAQSKDEQQRIRASTDLLLKDARVRQFEIELRQEGLSPNDPSWQNMVAKFLQYYAQDKLGMPKGSSILRWLMNN